MNPHNPADDTGVQDPIEGQVDKTIIIDDIIREVYTPHPLIALYERRKNNKRRSKP